MNSQSALIKLSFTRQPFQGIALSDSLMNQFQLKPKQKIMLRLGERSVQTRIFRHKRGPREMWIPASVKEKLLIPHQGLIHLKKDKNEFAIGPVIGILTTGIGRGTSRPESPRVGFFKHLLTAQQGEGAYYFLFTPHDVNWQSKSVNGFFLDPTTGWKRRLVAFPDVIYNRIPNRSTESTPAIQQFKRNVKLYTRARMFNPNFFDKWTIHEKMDLLPQTKDHVPETYRSPRRETVEKMLRRHGFVYLKPIGGSLGLGIVKVTLHPRHGYLCRYHQSGRNVLRRFTSLSTLLRHVFKNGKKLNSYLVQQGIPLMRVNGRPVDFRVHLYKNRQNNWVVTAIAAKVAGNGSVTTHVRTGGTVLSYKEVLRHAFGSKADIVEQDIKQVAIKLAESIESAVSHNLGELGFDIGVDTNGQIWMFEANSKPGRSIFKHPSLKQANRQSIRHILDYSFYLAQF
ncbi:MAG: YheC/YheD family protein [Bacillaceae bacterium]|nr:YheC/YheD family protein [Bacillaceae bacterium]